MDSQHGHKAPKEAPAAYEPPSIVVLGTVAELTRGQVGATDDLLFDGSQP